MRQTFKHKIGDIVYCPHVDNWGIITSYSIDKEFCMFIANIQWFNGDKDNFPIGSLYYESLETAA